MTKFVLQLAQPEPIVETSIVCGVANCLERGSALMVGSGRDEGRKVWICDGHAEYAISCGYTYVRPDV